MILCVGTTPVLQRTMIFDRVVIDAVNRAIAVEISTGGKSLNVARAAATLDAQPLACGFAGGDSGRQIRRLLDKRAIAHEFVDVPETQTRTCVTIIDRTSGAATELIEEPQAVAGEYWRQLAEKYSLLAARARVIVLSGTLAPGGPEDFYAQCVTQAAGAPVIVDAQGAALRLAMERRPYLVKPNRAELAATLKITIDSDASLRDAMRRVIDSGPRFIVVTLGVDGAIASDGSRFWRIEIPRVKVVSPLGSGDSFAAGLAAGIARDMPMPDTLRLACACAVANTMTSQPAMFHMDDVRAIEQQVRVRES